LQNYQELVGVLTHSVGCLMMASAEKLLN